MNTLKRDKKGEEEKIRIKLLTTNTPEISFPVWLAQRKAGNNSQKLKNKPGKVMYLHYQHKWIRKKKKLQHFNQEIIIMRVMIKENKFVITTESKSINLHLFKDFGNKLKNEFSQKTQRIYS